MWVARRPLILAAALAAVAVAVSAQQQPMSALDSLQLLFDRPGEPVFYPKGDNGEVHFRLPPEYVPERYQNKASEITDRFGETTPSLAVPESGGFAAAAGASRPSSGTPLTTVDVRPVTLPDLSLPMQLGRREQFSMFIPLHRRMAQRLVRVFLDMPTVEDFLSASAFCRERLNPYLFAYALSVAMLHRNDTQTAPLPQFASRFPEKYFDGGLFPEVRREANLVRAEQRIPLEIPLDWTGTDLDPEHRVAYFREDLGINLCHWHWHLVYPFSSDMGVVGKDRRGELFYYFHQQIIARYNMERFSNRLGRVRRFMDFREPMDDGYFPKLTTLLASRNWPPRQAGLKLKDVRRSDKQLEFDIADLERWRDRIFEAIHTGRLRREDENGTTVPIKNEQGIDLLGNVIEASDLSINRNLYGDMHNLGHIAIAFSHDPDHRHLEDFNIMGDGATTMRDPMFYRWHGFVDDMFQEHKKTLDPYTVEELEFPGVRVAAAQVQSDFVEQPNELRTFWQQSDLDLNNGLDFTPRGAVYARLTHLQHTPFTYLIQVENAGGARRGTVRIFLGPRHDERNSPLTLRDQRLYFVELDKFTFYLRPGTNVIQRRSEESSVTVPYNVTFRDLAARPTGGEGELQFNYCGCGWPQHMLLPMGTREGFQADLFVMVSDYAADEVVQTTPAPPCRAAPAYCGVLGQRYPDRRPMGFPFDRSPRRGAQTLQRFLTPNMAATPVQVRFTGEMRAPAAAGGAAGGATGGSSSGSATRSALRSSATGGATSGCSPHVAAPQGAPPGLP